MKRLILAAAIALLPVAAFADCTALATFKTNWNLTGRDVVYETSDTTSNQAVTVYDMGVRVPDEQRYAVVWNDVKTCTVEAEFRDLPGMMYLMETSVYDRN